MTPRPLDLRRLHVPQATPLLWTHAPGGAIIDTVFPRRKLAMPTIPGQPPPSGTLAAALELHAAGKGDDGEVRVYDAARAAKAEHGSDSHALARAYADLARYHFHTGKYKKAATEFRHAADKPLPADPAGRADRLAFMYGFAASLEALGNRDEAVRVLWQCFAFARNLRGADTPGSAAAYIPLAAAVLRKGDTAEAMRLAGEAYDALWKHGDPRVAAVVPIRAEAMKAVGRTDSPFADLVDLPEALAVAVVANVIAHRGEPARVRQVLADLLKFADRSFGDGHPAVADALAAVARHEAEQGDAGDAQVRTTATRRAVWSFAVRRLHSDLLANLEVGFEPGGVVHLGAHLSRHADDDEVAQLEDVLALAVEDLHSRGKPAGGA